MEFFATLAMALDTLPGEGRVLLLALLLTGALCGFARVLPDEPGSSLNVLYRKGALLALVLVPALVYLLDIRTPVPVEELARFDTPVPGRIALGLLSVWGVGVLICLYRLWRDLRATWALVGDAQPLAGPLEARVQHWRARLNLKAEVRVVCGGAEQSWHFRSLVPGKRKPALVVLPAAAMNWPVGVVDAMVLVQLAQIYQGSWRWLLYGRLVQALYWPAPWIGRLVRQLAAHLQLPGARLAAAAYRDPEGWQRDVRNLDKRAATLAAIELPANGAPLRLPNHGELARANPVERGGREAQTGTFEDKWSGTKRRHRDKQRDPYEQAYWLIAVASIVVGIATTLTIVKAPPEFDPQFLNIRWQDQMVRRLRDFYPESEAEEQEQPGEPPKRED